MEILKAILFGVVEGVTEWLPISSTGHLILLDELVKLDVSAEFASMFDVVIQLGAILAVIVLFFHKLNPFSPRKNKKQRHNTIVLWLKIVVSILPSGIIGVLLDDWMDAHLYNSFVVALALIVYGVAFIYVERRNADRTPRIAKVDAIDYRTALYIGCFQALSLIPGTSRSGSTILGGILLGVSRGAAAEFSFFMAIPTMLGASAIKVLKFLLSGVAMAPQELGILLVGCAVSFAVSLVVIKGLMAYVRKHSFSAFGVYRIILGAAVLLYFALKPAGA